MFKKFLTNQVEFKIDEQKNQVTAYASTYEKDLGGDIVVPGAYAKTLKEKFEGDKRQIKVLWQHDEREPIGYPIAMQEDSTGLLTVSQLSKTRRAMETMQLVKDRIIDKMSIGYAAPDTEMTKDGDRLLKTIDLYEYSFVTFPMNTGASILGAKGFNTPNEKGVVVEYLAEIFGLSPADMLEYTQRTEKGDKKSMDSEVLKDLVDKLASAATAVSDYIADSSDDTTTEPPTTDPLDDETMSLDDEVTEDDFDKSMEALNGITFK